MPAFFAINGAEVALVLGAVDPEFPGDPHELIWKFSHS